MKIDLSTSTALVTGAGRGIGRAIAEGLIDSGARVGVHYTTSASEAKSVAERGAGSLALRADLSDPAGARRLFAEAVAALGRVDVLVNNAAVAISSPVDLPHDTYVDHWNRTLAVNLVSVGVLCREAIRHFQSIGGGRIIHIASRAAFRGDVPDYMAYAASKGGMVALSRSIARGFGKDGVKSFVIAPGFTRTDMAAPFIEAYGEEMAMKDIALERMTEPGDIAPLVVFLASGLGDHATGSAIDVNAASYVR